MTTGEMVKISFRVEPDDRDGIVGETLWAERVGTDRFRLANTPFQVRGVSFRDVVFGRCRRWGGLAFAGVSLRGGHSTIWIAHRVDPTAAVARNHWARLHGLGCRYESSGRSLAVDVPGTSDFRAVQTLTEAGAIAGIWDFEVAHRGHFGAE